MKTRVGVIAAVLAAASVAWANPADAQVIAGTLLEGGTGTPVADAILALHQRDGRAVANTESDSTGTFLLQAPGPGVYFITARKVGYTLLNEGDFELGEGGRLEITAYIRPQPVEIEGVQATVERPDRVVDVERRFLERQGFYERQERTSGYFITPEDIARRPPSRPQDLFRAIPGVEPGRITGTPGSDNFVTLECAERALNQATASFTAWIDGARVFQGRTWDMLGYVQADDIMAVEVYPRPASLPLLYQTPGACGAILVWTKR
jgi:hypothetical protein